MSEESITVRHRTAAGRDRVGAVIVVWPETLSERAGRTALASMAFVLEVDDPVDGGRYRFDDCVPEVLADGAWRFSLRDGVRVGRRRRRKPKEAAA